MQIRLFSRLQESLPADGGDAGAVEETAAVVTPPAKIEPPKVDPGVQKRIDQMTYKYREQERRAIAAEKELADLRAGSKPKETVATEVVDKRKTLADFDYDDVAYEDYLAERVESRASKTAAEKAVKAVEERDQTKARETTAAERAAKWKTAAEAFTKDHPDFVEIVYGENLPFTDAVAELVAESDIGPQLAYHLAQNPDELARLSKLSPAAAGREIGKLEVKLTPASKEETSKEEPTEDDAEKTASAQEPPPTISKAPPPPPKLQVAASGSTKPATTDAKSDKLSDDEWFKAENKRLAALRKK